MKNLLKAIPLVASFVMVESAFAVPVDLTSLTTAVDFSTTTAGVLGVAAALIVVYIAWKAAKMILGAVRGG